MEIKYFLSGLIFLSVLSSCNKKSHYTEHSSGLEYNLVEMNPEGQTPKPGDILVVSFSVQNSSGDMVESNESYRLQLGRPIYQGDLFTGLSMIQVGDSVQFRLDALAYYEKTRKRDMPDVFEIGDKAIISLRLKQILSPENLETERLGIYHKDEDQEMELLQDYLKNANIDKTPNESGVYVIVKTMGNGVMAQDGKKLKVHYTGTTIDGKVFDSSLQRNQPLEFQLGKGQVIRGWDEGLRGLKAGTKAKLIIPSKLAYGQKGFKNLIQPYSTLIFEIEIIEVSD